MPFVECLAEPEKLEPRSAWRGGTQHVGKRREKNKG